MVTLRSNLTTLDILLPKETFARGLPRSYGEVLLTRGGSKVALSCNVVGDKLFADVVLALSSSLGVSPEDEGKERGG